MIDKRTILGNLAFLSVFVALPSAAFLPVMTAPSFLAAATSSTSSAAKAHIAGFGAHFVGSSTSVGNCAYDDGLHKALPALVSDAL